MPLRAAIIGTGRIGWSLELDPLRHKPHTHAAWYQATPSTRLVAGADTDAGALEGFGRALGVGRDHLYGDYRTMLERERPDLVSVCAYAPERVEMALAAIEAGARGLWLEKAVGCAVSEAESLLRCARAAGVSVVVNHPRSQDGRYHAVRRLIAEGTLGPLETVHAIFSGRLLHTGSHAWEVLESWCGPWTEVRSWPAADAQPHEDGGGRVHVVFASGIHAFVSALDKAYYVFHFDLLFRSGRIQIGNEGSRLFRPEPSHRYDGFVELADAPEPLDGPGEPPLVEVLAAAVEAGETAVESLEAAIRALTLGVAVVQAGGRRGAPLTPDEVDPDFYVASV